MDIEKKEKIKKIGLRIWLGISTVLSLLFVVLIAVACGNNNVNKETSAICEVEENNDIQFLASKKQVSYDDSDFTITIEVDDLLGNYTYDNFGYALYEIISNNSVELTNVFTSSFYGSYIINLGEGWAVGDSNVYIRWEFADESLSDDYVVFNMNELTDNAVFSIYFDSDSVPVYDLVFTINSSYYVQVRNAVLTDLGLDIPVNQVEDFVPSIFTALTTSIGGFIGSLGTGIVAMTAIFYADGELTAIGLLSVVVVALSLGYFLFRLIIGLIRMRG